jgi:hypothetical protein
LRLRDTKQETHTRTQKKMCSLVPDVEVRTQIIVEGNMAGYLDDKVRTQIIGNQYLSYWTAE